MGKEEMAELLETMLNDTEVAGRVAEGDFSDLSEGELSGAERALLSAAGTDLDDDVSGFGIDAFLKLGDIDGESKDSRGYKYTDLKIPSVDNALKYLGTSTFTYNKF